MTTHGEQMAFWADIDTSVDPVSDPQPRRVARPKRAQLELTPLTDLEKSVAEKLASARMPPATASKRFARELASGCLTRLSDRGRKFMAYVANRFRRQYQLSKDERDWVDRWLGK